MTSNLGTRACRSWWLAIAALAASLLVPLAGAAGAQQATCRGLAVTVDLALGQQPTDGADVILGTEGPDEISAGDGNDVICGLGGKDVIRGQRGNDTILGGKGADVLRGGSGADVIVGGAGRDRIFGHAGPDRLAGSTGEDKLRGNNGDDRLRGGAGPDSLDGGSGTDFCNGGGDENDKGAGCEHSLDVEIGLDVSLPPASAAGAADLPVLSAEALPPVPSPSPSPIPSPVPPSGDAPGTSVIAPPPGVTPPPDGPPPAPGTLTAADVDDNLNFAAFLNYLEDEGQNGADIDLSDRFVLTLTDMAQVPLSNAEVEIASANGDSLVTYANAQGTVHVFPDYFGLPDQPSYSVTVRDTQTGATSTFEIDMDSLGADRTGEFAVFENEPGVDRIKALDVAFVIDATGSMGDEMNYLKAEFAAIVEGVEDDYPGIDLRFALVVYRDYGDAFVTRSFDFTSADAMLADLQNQNAYGGGDYPEAMDDALAAANGLSWRDGDVSRLVILNADAPPHAQNHGVALDNAEKLRARGIRVYPLAASGVGDSAEYLMRVMAATTGARHLFLTDDSGVGNPHDVPDGPCYVVTQLDDLLERVLEAELAGERIEPSEDDIIRTVGDYQNGVCGPTQ